MPERIAVVGLGYVGLPLSLLAVQQGFQCVGVDTNLQRVQQLSSGESFTPDIPPGDLNAALEAGFSVTDSFEAVAECEVVVVCVPTPLSVTEGMPDLSAVLGSMGEIASRISPGALIILESTVAPGTTEGPVLNTFLAQGKNLDQDFFLAYSPERINPGSNHLDLRQIPKVVSGCSSESLRRAALFYQQLVDEVVPVAGTKEAEFAKLLENSYRLVNVSLVNELALAAHKMGIDFQEVTRAAATKPYGFHPFFPSAGAGGHCIPVDPVYLNNEISSATGSTIEVLDSAIDVNKGFPRRIISELLSTEYPLEGKRILVAGLSYKPGVPDTRNSPAIGAIEELSKQGALVEVFDELVAQLEIGSKIFRPIDLEASRNEFDFAILLQPQAAKTLRILREKSRRIFITSSRFGEV